MALRSLRPCKRCVRALTRDASGYCDAPECAGMRHAGWQRHQQRRAAEGRADQYGASWRRTRAAALRRDKGLCQACAAEGKVRPAVDVDHVIPTTRGGTDDLSNLQSLCTMHHTRKTAAEGNAAQGRRTN